MLLKKIKAVTKRTNAFIGFVLASITPRRRKIRDITIPSMLAFKISDLLRQLQ